MDKHEVITRLQHHWDFDAGFFGLLRRGEFDQAKLDNLIRDLQLTSMDSLSEMDRQIVSLIWIVPLFMVWQKERVSEKSSDAANYEKAMNQVLEAVAKILGYP